MVLGVVKEHYYLMVYIRVLAVDKKRILNMVRERYNQLLFNGRADKEAKKRSNRNPRHRESNTTHRLKVTGERSHLQEVGRGLELPRPGGKKT